jgi:DNA-binding response OmpR family regulator
MTVPPFQTPNFRGRLLLVEDASVLREIQLLMLRRAGYEVVACSEPAEMLAEAGVHPFDAVVLNSDRPAVQSAEQMQALRRLRANVPVIALVARASAEQIHELTCRGVSAIFDRPKTPMMLVQQIDGLLNGPALPAASRLIAECTVPRQTGELRRAGTGHVLAGS